MYKSNKIHADPEQIILYQQAIIQSLADRISGEPTKKRVPAEILLRQAFQYLCNYGESMPQSVTAVLLFKTLLRLMELSNNHINLRQGALAVVSRITSTSWFDWRDIKVRKTAEKLGH